MRVVDHIIIIHQKFQGIKKHINHPVFELAHDGLGYLFIQMMGFVHLLAQNPAPWCKFKGIDGRGNIDNKRVVDTLEEQAFARMAKRLECAFGGIRKCRIDGVFILLRC